MGDLARRKSDPLTRTIEEQFPLVPDPEDAGGIGLLTARDFDGRTDKTRAGAVRVEIIPMGEIGETGEQAVKSRSRASRRGSAQDRADIGTSGILTFRRNYGMMVDDR